MSAGPVADLALRLRRNAEAACRHYLSNGRREGRTWRVGDVGNARGQSLCVRLSGPDDGAKAAGKWIDFATGQHGDLLDLIALSQGFSTLRDTLREARRFLGLPQADAGTGPATRGIPVGERIAAARRLWHASGPIAGTLAEIYLRSRGLTPPTDPSALRFHPACRYRLDSARFETWPAMIAVVTDNAGRLQAVHRTYLRRDGSGKAPVATPRRALGLLTGHAVRFGIVDNATLAVGEGIETMLALRTALPDLPVAAALSAYHLASFEPPTGMRCLYIAADRDRAGLRAARALETREAARGIDIVRLLPRGSDHEEDLCTTGIDEMTRALFAVMISADRTMKTVRQGGA